MAILSNAALTDKIKIRKTEVLKLKRSKKGQSPPFQAIPAGKVKNKQSQNLSGFVYFMRMLN
ncbi:hypothetical protein BCU70_07905 [Vibrio sp. 10N.286.49.C2]|uniref:hypothetical protein n=1 Tax=unclassified Vibrio TaxID=2614977 RepID=UPI000C83B78A|nr:MULTISPECIES: hypothetical protein [unclassified Vibrio]PMH29560.1 hypothetical protein BCU70_07905 [Vibrio sp. 10N.286.49.C2]PMH56075.1 hypothetical protein BCU66_07815 [Vibrio sp. 10N.286.49.B1]PMH77664.1 hypothetical protein BCU58_12235 [Vibrio sp. 10N.286.48.B7]